MTKFFGTDGVRGIAGDFLDVRLACDLGRFSAYVLSDKNRKKIRMTVGKDTRISGNMLEAAFIAGALSQGADIITLGVIPTPAVAHITRTAAADAGVVISASHNPMEYNGIKFFNSDGEKLSDSLEEEIEAYLSGEKQIASPLTGARLGRLQAFDGAADDYIAHATGRISCSLNGLKIALDCSNGANSAIAPSALERLGAEVITTAVSPDGININAGCGSVHIENLCDFVKQTGADVGIAFDGDADRVLAVDETGKVFTGDSLIGILAIEYKRRGVLGDAPVVGTVMSNMGLAKSLEKHGIGFVATKVGDRFVYEKMKELGSVIGGEESGHIISMLHNTTGDGLCCAVEFLKVLKESGRKASELRKEITIFPQVVANAGTHGASADEILADEKLSALISETQKKYTHSGRILIRPSGTEPVIRVMLEGDNFAQMQADAEKIKILIESVAESKGK